MANASDNALCEPHPVLEVALLFPLPIIGTLVNVTVGCAATCYRKSLLRQNYVYLCVISTLLSNVVFLALNLWDSSGTMNAILTLKLDNPGKTEMVSVCYDNFLEIATQSMLLWQNGRPLVS